MSLLDSSPTVGETAGAFYLGVIFATALWGAGCIQLHHYFSVYNDGWPVKSLVIVVAMLVTIHQGLIVNTSYTYLVSEFGNFNYLGAVVKGHNVSMLLCGLVCTMVQCFLTYRIWKLSRGNVPLVAALGILLIAQRIVGVAYFVVVTPFNRFPDLTRVAWLSRTTNIIGAICDLSIALVLIYQLWRSRTGFRCSDTVIKRLIILTISTGLATSLCALMTLIMSLVYSNTTTYLAFFIYNSPLYLNALMATLNLRIVPSQNRNGIESFPDSAMLSPLRTRSGTEKSYRESNSHMIVNVMTETHSDRQSTINKLPVTKTSFSPYPSLEILHITHPSNAESCVPSQKEAKKPTSNRKVDAM